MLDGSPAHYRAWYEWLWVEYLAQGVLAPPLTAMFCLHWVLNWEPSAPQPELPAPPPPAQVEMHRSTKQRDSHGTQFTTGWRPNRPRKMKTFNDFQIARSFTNVSSFLIGQFNASEVDVLRCTRFFSSQNEQTLWSCKTPTDTWRRWFVSWAERTLFRALRRILLQGSQISPDESKTSKRYQLPTALARFTLGAWSNNRDVLELLISFYTQTVNNCSQIKCKV